MSIRRRVASQAAGPRGAIGWIVARIMPAFTEGQSRKLAELSSLEPDDDLLELACGSGSLLHKYAAHVGHVAGLDHSEVQIELARKRNRERIAAGTAEIVVGDSAALPWEDGRFSVVACNCFDCLADPQASLKEMHRVLRPGGRVVFMTDYFPDEQRAQKSERAWGLPARTVPELRRMMEEDGFSDISLSHDKGQVVAKAMKP